MKVIIVDNSAADRRLCRILLEEIHGPRLELFEETAAAPALKTCREVTPDCVLLDHKLPDMTGPEFLARLRAEQPEGEPDFAIVMLTGWANEQAAVDALRAGAHDYLEKSRITADGLNLAVQKATQKVGLLRALRQERDRLSRSLAEKEILIKEVHHRVKNNLQVIASLLRLQAGAIGVPELNAALRDSQHRVESMALIHEQLYGSHDLRVVDLARSTRQLVSNLFDAYGADPTRINGNVDIPDNAPLALSVDQAIPVSLILNELISNSLKHAFPDGRTGTISVEGARRPSESGMLVELGVRDNGVGFRCDFDAHRSRSLGLEIVRILTKQLRGELIVEQREGSAFRLIFPERRS
jgi:two-component sensor histidine kinase/CheY-like chemotaxis protein